MDNLTVGQRIDVYEVVAHTGVIKTFTIGSFRPGKRSNHYLVDVMDDNGDHRPLVKTPFYDYQVEAKPIGTFIVKSMKGGSNA